MTKPLKLGIISDSRFIPAWVHDMLEKMVLRHFSEIQLFIVAPENVGQIDSNHQAFLFRLYVQLDRLVFRKRYSFDNPIDAISMLSKTQLAIQLTQLNAVKKVTDQQFDILFNFSSLIFQDHQQPLAKFGLWNIDSAKNEIRNNLACIFRKMKEHEPVIELDVRVTNSSFGHNIVIHRSWLPVNYHSLHINRFHVGQVYASTIPRLVEGILQQGLKYIQDQGRRYRPSASESNYLPSLTSLRVVTGMARTLFKYLRQRLSNKAKDRWFLMLKIATNLFPVLPSSFEALVPPPDRAWADPFVVRQNGSIFVFAEEFLYSKGKGYISLLKLNTKGELQGFEKILEKPFHMSYPFVFQHADNWYMVPETSANHTIELYESDDFPRKWHFVMNLMGNVDAVDSSVFFHEGRWWLFTALKGTPAWPDYNELYLFYADNLLTNHWNSHPLNPIVTDVRTSRPAGRIFVHEGKIYRPSQDCSFNYGRAINLNEIDLLTTDFYSEHLSAKINPDWNLSCRGTHTFNCDSDTAVIDVYRHQNPFSPKHSKIQ